MVTWEEKFSASAGEIPIKGFRTAIAKGNRFEENS